MSTFGPCRAGAALEDSGIAMEVLAIDAWTAVGKVAQGRGIDEPSKQVLKKIASLLDVDSETWAFVSSQGQAGAPPQARPTSRVSVLKLAQHTAKIMGDRQDLIDDPMRGARSLAGALRAACDEDVAVANELRPFMRRLYLVSAEGSNGAPDRIHRV